ncbi:enoyl-CoA hydratase domain-containing protein 2, mitochondrial isoform X2 [Oncorhynchus nerka]|uniref:enoyl-CoA hydratase domain-containing protein 2, mitochondrial isoform X2 n=1 Tax=Oncorhynchus nerka TaxID=8023 RepID=UPI00112FF015|nr:enoyl-CoA hydratase domain-containing protein 2, mitochondrial isoform X2 [Oncorhynchus nerka]
MTFLRRFAIRHCSLSRGFGALSPASLGAPGSVTLHRLGVEKLPSRGRPFTGHNDTHTSWLHTETPESVEVDLKRLYGEDTGREGRSLNIFAFRYQETELNGSLPFLSIAEVLMCRQKAKNALGRVFVSQMRELVSSLHHDTAVRVVVFRSLVQGVFCAGADLKERAEMNHSDSDLFVHGLRSLMTEIALLPMPTVAAVDGFALGGGLELALACDLRTAGGSQRLPRAVGFALAKELIFTGRRVDGQRAVDMGLVNRATEQNSDGDAAYREALSLAREILPQAPIAVRMAKEAMNRGMEVDITSGMAIERMCYARVIPTRDRQEGMAAFIEKRPPRYTGE